MDLRRVHAARAPSDETSSSCVVHSLHTAFACSVARRGSVFQIRARAHKSAQDAISRGVLGDAKGVCWWETEGDRTGPTGAGPSVARNAPPLSTTIRCTSEGAMHHPAAGHAIPGQGTRPGPQRRHTKGLQRGARRLAVAGTGPPPKACAQRRKPCRMHRQQRTHRQTTQKRARHTQRRYRRLCSQHRGEGGGIQGAAAAGLARRKW